MPRPVPERIGAYRVQRVLGEGGMGDVYEAVDEALDRAVAIKVLKRELTGDAIMKERFLREARAMAAVTSPHVVKVHAVGDVEGAPFIVMELLQGGDLNEILRRSGPLSPREVVGVLLDAIAGLSAAAKKGIVHRDVKPANLFLVDGRAKVTDFGLARQIAGHAQLTQAGLVVGTPYYMAPEIGRGQPATIASDIYALGATAFELLVGKPPFNAETAVQIIAAHILEPAPSLRERCPHAPAELGAILERMLAKQALDRFADYDALERALREVPFDAPAAPKREAPTPNAEAGAPERVDAAPSAAPARRLPLPIAWAAAAAVLVVIGVVAASGGDDKPSPSQKQVDVAPLFAALDTPQADDAKAQLTTLDGIDDRLRDLARTGTWRQRHHALAILEARDAEVDREAFAIQDLRDGMSCERRKMGLMLLKRVGASEAALKAVSAASKRLPDNVCMLFDFGGAEAAIRGRQRGPSR